MAVFDRSFFQFWAKMVISHAEFCLGEGLTEICIVSKKRKPNTWFFIGYIDILSKKQLLLLMFFDKPWISGRNF